MAEADVLEKASVHRPFQRRLFQALLVGFALMTLNGLYLSALPSLHPVYIGMLLAHLLVGFLFVLPFLIFGLSHLWRALGHKNTRAKATGFATLSSALLCLGSGVFITFAGGFGANRWILCVHIVSSMAVIPLYLLHRAARRLAEEKSQKPKRILTAPVVGVLVAASLMALVLTVRERAPWRERALGNGKVKMGVGVGEAESPFFASSAETKNGGFLPLEMFTDQTNRYCGLSGCHPDIYKQWQSSAHRFSSFNNPFYRRTTLYQEERGFPRAITRFCSSCHEPAMQFSGLMKDGKKIDVESEAAHAGVGCLACHSIVDVKSPRGNCDYVIEQPRHYPWAFSKNKFLHWLNLTLIRVKPKMHKETFLKPFMRTALYCSVCHKVGIPAAANNYHWQRGFSEYDSWQLSGISGQGARSFYNPKEFKTNCAVCHMPLIPSDDAGQREGKVHDHSFPGANTALPAWRGDEEHLKKTVGFLQDDWMSVDVFGIRRRAAKGETLFAPLRDGDEVVGGETVRVEVVVRNKRVGHQFTGGTRDAHEPWVEFVVTDKRGRTLFHSGYLDERGYLDKWAHLYRSNLIDRTGRLVNKRNAAIDWIATVYGRQIDPATCDVVHYRFTIPQDCGNEITITAKLNYRKWRLWYHKWVFQGMPAPNQDGAKVNPLIDEREWVFDVSKPLPPLPIVTMAQDSVTLKVLPAGSRPSAKSERKSVEDRDRFYDYGVGLLVQRDLRRAEAAFRKVIKIDPRFVEGRISLARTLIEDGDLLGAMEQLEKAWYLDPDYFKTHYFLALVYKGLGRYDDALKLLRSVQQKFPHDRIVCNQIGRIYFLKRDYAKAVREFQKTLQVDPEDVFAHFNLMLCYKGLGKSKKAEQHRQLYLTYKPDETINRLTGPYRRRNPHDNNESQLIHDHVLK